VQIGPYVIQDELARGGQGVVYRAQDTRLNRSVVLKLLQTDSEHQTRRLLREAQAMARLRHPHLVPLHETGEHEGKPYLVLPFVSGESLQERLERGGPLPLEDALRFTAEVGQALGAAHAEGLVHRDVKPANVLVDEQDRALLTDFGLVKQVGPGRAESLSLSVRGHFLGTPGYWPPEQAYGDHDKVGPAADVYALGALLYALLTGRAPREAQNIQAALYAFQTPVEPISGFRENVPRWVERLVRACFEAERAQRPALAVVLRALEEQAFEGHRVSASSASRYVAGVGAALALTAGLIALAVGWGSRTPPGPSAGPAPVPSVDDPEPQPAVDPPPSETPQTARERLATIGARLANHRAPLRAEEADRLTRERDELRERVGRDLADALLAREVPPADLETVEANLDGVERALDPRQGLLLASQKYRARFEAEGDPSALRLARVCGLEAHRLGSAGAYFDLYRCALLDSALSEDERAALADELLRRGAEAGATSAVATRATHFYAVAREGGSPEALADLSRELDRLEDRFGLHKQPWSVNWLLEASCAVAFEALHDPDPNPERQASNLERAGDQLLIVCDMLARESFDEVRSGDAGALLDEIARALEALGRERPGPR